MNQRAKLRLFFRKLETLFMEFLPFVCIIAMTTAGLCYIHREGWDLPYIDEQGSWYRVLSIILSFGWFIFLLASSRAMGFCRIHRLMLSHLYASFLLIYLNRWWGLGSLLLPFLYLMTTLGCFLIGLVTYKLIIKRLK